MPNRERVEKYREVMDALTIWLVYIASQEMVLARKQARELADKIIAYEEREV